MKSNKIITSLVIGGLVVTNISTIAMTKHNQTMYEVNIKRLEDEMKTLKKEKDQALKNFEELKGITYNETHYNPYNLLEKSGANE